MGKGLVQKLSGVSVFSENGKKLVLVDIIVYESEGLLYFTL